MISLLNFSLLNCVLILQFPLLDGELCLTRCLNDDEHYKLSLTQGLNGRFAFQPVLGNILFPFFSPSPLAITGPLSEHHPIARLGCRRSHMAPFSTKGYITIRSFATTVTGNTQLKGRFPPHVPVPRGERAELLRTVAVINLIGASNGFSPTSLTSTEHNSLGIEGNKNAILTISGILLNKKSKGWSHLVALEERQGYRSLKAEILIGRDRITTSSFPPQFPPWIFHLIVHASACVRRTAHKGDSCGRTKNT
jgi:hypothetical protein